MVAMRHAASRSQNALIGTVRKAAARHGWLGLASRVIGAFREGGFGHLLQRYRSLRGSVFGMEILVSPGEKIPDRVVDTTMRHLEEPLAPDSCSYVLRSNHSMSLRHFNDFLDRWDKHPAIRKLLTNDTALPDVGYTMVVTKHAELGLSRLRDTLELAQHLAQRATIDVRVIVYDPDGDCGPAERATDYPSVTCIHVDGSRRLLELLVASPLQDLVHFVVCGDQIAPVFAEIVRRSIIPSFDLVLMDMYFVDPGGNVFPILLPGLNLIHALNVDCFLSRVLLKVGLAVEVLRDQGNLDVYAAATTALARCMEPRSTLRAYHAAFPFLCISESQDAIQRRRTNCLNRDTPLRLSIVSEQTDKTCFEPDVSIIICTKNNGFLLEQLVERLNSGDTAHRIAEIIVVANQITNPYARSTVRRLAEGGRIKLIDYDKPFNFSAQCNVGAATAEGELLLFLNDDVVPVNREWLTELIAPLQQPAVGVVGPLLLYPDQTVQHAGMFLGFNNLAGHTLRGASLPENDYAFMASAPRQVMSVTGAALCMRKRDFEALNGFDQNLFALHIQDVDLCLRAHYSGWTVVFNPRSVLLHMESVSVKPTLSNPRIGELRGREHEAFLRRWSHVLQSDEFHNPNFVRGNEACRQIIRPRG